MTASSAAPSTTRSKRRKSLTGGAGKRTSHQSRPCIWVPKVVCERDTISLTTHTLSRRAFIISYDNKTGNYATQATTVFQELRISGNFSTEYRYPSALGDAFKLIRTRDLNFTGDELTVSTNKPLIYAGIYARAYDRDPPYVQSDYGTVIEGSNSVNG